MKSAIAWHWGNVFLAEWELSPRCVRGRLVHGPTGRSPQRVGRRPGGRWASRSEWIAQLSPPVMRKSLAKGKSLAWFIFQAGSASGARSAAEGPPRRVAPLSKRSRVSELRAKGGCRPREARAIACCASAKLEGRRPRTGRWRSDCGCCGTDGSERRAPFRFNSLWSFSWCSSSKGIVAIRLQRTAVFSLQEALDVGA